ncbi:zinc finger protein 346 [Lampris incognitus]|uniref:zinc finger protein 346 n=1 Tax=Lampris incognitus TaxID=2546036 RepID=UPI0024B49083|nr:zinc finger protein 346 [Lampris incognitus]
MRTIALLTGKINMAVEMPMEDFPYLPSGVNEVNKMIEQHGDLFSDSQCKICSAVLISESQKLAHYQSKKHANKVRRYFSIKMETEPAFKKLKPLSSDSDYNNGDTDRTKVCLVCNMTFTSAVTAESHYQGEVHTKNLRLKTVGPQIPASSQTGALPAQLKKGSAEESSGVTARGNSDPHKFCSICQASFNNPLMAQQHYVGKKHKKQMTKMKLLETYGPSTTPASTVKGYPCTLCKLELNSVEQYQAHVSGAKHKNQLKRIGMNPAENQQAPGVKQNNHDNANMSDNQYGARKDQYGVRQDQYGVGQDQYRAVENEYAEDYRYT